MRPDIDPIEGGRIDRQHNIGIADVTRQHLEAVVALHHDGLLKESLPAQGAIASASGLFGPRISCADLRRESADYANANPPYDGVLPIISATGRLCA